MKTPSLQTEVRDLYARYQLSGGNAEVNDIRASIMGGTLEREADDQRCSRSIDCAIASVAERLVAGPGSGGDAQCIDAASALERTR